MTVICMEEHFQAYFAWKAQGFEKAWCWHVDAHLDIGDVGFGPERLAALKSCQDQSQASKLDCLGSSYLPWGGLHCGNYLYPAIREGLIGKLTWVLPPDLPVAELLPWAKRHLNEWFELSPTEMRSLELKDETVHGTLLGIPFEMGTVDHLVRPTEPVLLDIDIDYFLEDDGKVWQKSEVFAQLIQDIPSLMTTIAYSVKGGFTPETHRVLADPLVGNGPVQHIDQEPYRERPVDRLAALVRCHKYDEAIALLEPWTKPDLEVSYLKGMSLHALKRYEETLELWKELLATTELPSDGQHYLLNLCAELLLELGRPQESLDYSLKAQKLDRTSYTPYWTEAQAREKLGDDQKTIKALRRAAKLSENQIFGLKIRTALVRAYRRQGKEGLAMVETQKINAIDPDRQVRAFALLGV